MIGNKYLCLLFYVIILSSCFQDTNSLANTPPLESTRILEEPVSLFNTWKVIRVNNSISPPQNTIRATSDRKENTVSTITAAGNLVSFSKEAIQINLSINTCGVGFALKEKDSTITFLEQITCTEACCDSNEDEFLAGQFSGSFKYFIQGQRLTLQAKNRFLQFTLVP